jgi:peptide/nickel transport system permease protein
MTAAMGRLLLRRLAHAVAVVWLVTTATFALIHLAPGDPLAAFMDDPRLTPAVAARWRAEAGLDRPLATQYARHLGNALRGNFGWSVGRSRWVSELLADAVPRTLLLMGVAIAMSLALGVVLGVMQAAGRRGLASRATSAVGLLLYSMPSFWLALVLMLLVGVHWRWLPTSGVCDPAWCGYESGARRILDVARHLLLPALTLTLTNAAVLARFQRAAVLEIMHADWVRTARAKGADERTVLWRHVVRNALLPTITVLGLSLPALLGGAVFVERVFAWPGMGDLAVAAIAGRDYAVVLAVTTVGAALVCVGSLVADVAASWIDPRIKLT